MSDRASKALAEASLPGEPRTYYPPPKSLQWVPILPHCNASLTPHLTPLQLIRAQINNQISLHVSALRAAEF
jgi:hypothetical protein